jgi:hypothetical protein
MPRKGFFSLVASMLLFTLTPLAANALVITLEPDDYAPGTDLSTVSPYVTLQSITPTYPGVEINSIHADDDGALGDPDYVAPTGNLTFGNHGFFVFGTEPDVGGFSMSFHQAVNSVSLLANSEYPPGLLAIWAAFDQAGNIIGTGSAGNGVPLGETFGIDIVLDGIWSVVVGGDDSMAAINFDHLVFEFDDPIDVPAPGTLILLLSGLLVMALRNKSVS